MKKASFIILLLSIITITAAAQTAKKHFVKSKSPVAAAQPGPGATSKLRTVLITDGELDLLLNSAANQNGFSGYIMTTPTPANQIPQATTYFQGVLQRVVDQRKVWLKADADSVAAIKKDTTAKKP